MLTPYADKPQGLHGGGNRRGNNNNWISDVKFCPNGEFVAFSAHDGHVFIYETTNLKSSINGKNKGKCWWFISTFTYIVGLQPSPHKFWGGGGAIFFDNLFLFLSCLFFLNRWSRK
jgi:hypothetical protein